MKYLSIVVLIVAASTLINADIGGDYESTIRIVTKLCLGAKDEPNVPRKFFECYENVSDDARRAFLTCQWDTFGFYLDTKVNISIACGSLHKFPQYSSCLVKEFAAIGQDLKAAATIVNICQAKVVGIS